MKQINAHRKRADKNKKGRFGSRVRMLSGYVPPKID